MCRRRSDVCRVQSLGSLCMEDVHSTSRSRNSVAETHGVYSGKRPSARTSFSPKDLQRSLESTQLARVTQAQRNRAACWCRPSPSSRISLCNPTRLLPTSPSTFASRVASHDGKTDDSQSDWAKHARNSSGVSSPCSLRLLRLGRFKC